VTRLLRTKFGLWFTAILILIPLAIFLIYQYAPTFITTTSATPAPQQTGITQNTSGNFAAYYTQLSKGAAWESASRTREHTDIMVRINDTTAVQLWRGTSYLPILITNGNETPFEEIVPRNGDGTADMPDRTNLFSHVRIIENNAQQAVIHWRYLPTFADGNPRGTDPDLFSEPLPTKHITQLFTVYPRNRPFVINSSIFDSIKR